MYKNVGASIVLPLLLVGFSLLWACETIPLLLSGPWETLLQYRLIKGSISLKNFRPRINRYTDVNLNLQDRHCDDPKGSMCGRGSH